MVKRRRSYETGHRPKFLAVVDGSEECAKAVRFAARRCARVGASIVLLGVATPPEHENWLGVGEVMQAEAEAEAEKRLETAAAAVRTLAGLEPEKIVRVGNKADELVKLIEEDEDIALLVLAAGTGKAGSDVDLLVIGDAGLRALAPRLRPAAERLGREINPVTMTAAEFIRDRTKKPFLRDVLAKDKLFVKGNSDELARLE